MSDRRQLSFANLAEVMPDVDRLLLGHRTAGRWTLGQICNHLSNAIIVSMDGGGGVDPAPWLVRVTIGPIVLRNILRSGRVAEGIKLPAKALPRPDLNDRAEAEALRGALRLYSEHARNLAPHPFFGTLDRDQWTRLHCIHCAHHLGFVHPTT